MKTDSRTERCEMSKSCGNHSEGGQGEERLNQRIGRTEEEDEPGEDYLKKRREKLTEYRPELIDILYQVTPENDQDLYLVIQWSLPPPRQWDYDYSTMETTSSFIHINWFCLCHNDGI